MKAYGPPPKLRVGERQGDVFANVEEPFTLAGERGIDHERRQREKATKAKAARDFAARNQLDFETNPRRTMKNALKYYVGIAVKTDRRQVFGAHKAPTTATHGRHFNAVIGPFTSLRAAYYVRDHGANNPQIRCPDDAEKLCRVKPGPSYQRVKASLKSKMQRLNSARPARRAALVRKVRARKAGSRGRSPHPRRKNPPDYLREWEAFNALNNSKGRSRAALHAAAKRMRDPANRRAALRSLGIMTAGDRAATVSRQKAIDATTRGEIDRHFSMPRLSNPRKGKARRRKLSPAQLRAGFGGKAARRRNPKTSCKSKSRRNPASGAAGARFVIGKSQVNGFTGFYDGDLFKHDGNFFALTSSGRGWTLRPLKGDGKVDYSAPPLKGWIDVDGAPGLIHKLNEAWSNAN
jgi:hypothetical protein